MCVPRSWIKGRSFGFWLILLVKSGNLKGRCCDGHSLLPRTFQRKQFRKIPAVEGPSPRLAGIPSEAGALGERSKIEDQRAVVRICLGCASLAGRK